MNSDHDVSSTEERLRTARVEPDAFTLDRALTTARDRARRRAPRGNYLRSKVAIALVLTSGLAVSSTGVTLAFQGPSGSGNASSAQYAPALPNSQGEPGQQQQNSLPEGQTQTLAGNPQSSNGSNGDNGNAGVQAPRQVAATDAASGDKLPFTGFAAIPVIVLGLAMILGGVLLQRRTASRRA